MHRYKQVTVYDIVDIDWNDEGNIEVGWRGDHIFILKFLVVVGAIFSPVLAGFFAVDRMQFGWTEWLWSGLPLVAGCILAGLASLMFPSVTLDRRAGEVRIGGRTLPFEEISVVQVTEQRHWDGGTPGGVFWYSVEVVDRNGDTWTVQSARQPHLVEQIRDRLVDELEQRGIDADW